MNQVQSFVLLILFITSNITCNAEKVFTTEDKTYENNIKTVLLYPQYNPSDSTGPINPPIVHISQPYPLVLEFDELGNNYNSYYVKIIHCNADWTVSTLSPVNYLDDYDEFYITSRRGSVNTRIPYVHYMYNLPKVTMTGNFLVKVYRNSDEDDFILTRRFCVYDNQISVYPTVKFSTDPSVRNVNEQVDFNINYGNVEVINPVQNLKVVLRQNNRWNKAITGLIPTTINQENSYLEYFYFNRENNFPGGNEYRIIEIKSALFNGMNVMKVTRDLNHAEAIVYPDKSRAGEAYVQPLVPDMDGKFYIVNQETGDTEIMADYMLVTFNFESPTPAPGKVYVFGGLTDWKLDKSFEMSYNNETKKYSCQVLLKQGVYNYSYVLANPQNGVVDEDYYEGSYSITQNIYDILVYYRPFGSRADLLLGYKSVNYLKR
jgi:hypothetical protein